MENLEIVGFLLIICGILYIFLQGMGKLSRELGEIESKTLSVKGGAGLILVGIGVFAMLVGSNSNLVDLISDTGVKILEKSQIRSATQEFNIQPQKISFNSENSNYTPVPSQKTVALKKVKESGYLINDRDSVSHGSSIIVGDDSYYNRVYQAFLTFNIVDIPGNATLSSVTLDLSDYSDTREQEIFEALGCLGVYEHDYGVLDDSDFYFGSPQNSIFKWCSYEDLESPVPNNYLMSALQDKLGKGRFQIRLQFDRNTDNDDSEDRITFGSPKLIVSYIEP